jgi:hypothetical protein
MEWKNWKFLRNLLCFLCHRSSDYFYYFNKRKKTAFFCRFFFENITLTLEKQNEMFTAHYQAPLVIGNKDRWGPTEDTFQYRDMLYQPYSQK